MIFTVIFLLCVLMLLLGFILGMTAIKKPDIKEIKPKLTDDELNTLNKELSNFLSYDGSVQP